jgi:hypothetical protein
MNSGKNSAFNVDSEPISPREEVMFSLAGRLTAFANCGTSILEIHSTVINRGNHNLTSTICEAVLPISDDPNKPVMEWVSAIVHHRDALYNNLSTAADIHPALFWRPHCGEAMWIERQLLHEFWRNKEISCHAFTQTIWYLTSFKVEKAWSTSWANAVGCLLFWWLLVRIVFRRVRGSD